jgi:hypothetical protein
VEITGELGCDFRPHGEILWEPMQKQQPRAPASLHGVNHNIAAHRNLVPLKIFEEAHVEVTSVDQSGHSASHGHG